MVEVVFAGSLVLGTPVGLRAAGLMVNAIRIPTLVAIEGVVVVGTTVVVVGVIELVGIVGVAVIVIVVPDL